MGIRAAVSYRLTGSPVVATAIVTARNIILFFNEAAAASLKQRSKNRCSHLGGIIEATPIENAIMSLIITSEQQQ